MIRPAEAARRLGVSRQYVHKEIKSGNLRTVVLYGIRLVEEEELARYKEEGRPKAA